MRLVILAVTLTLATATCAQEAPKPAAPEQFLPPTVLSQGSSHTCLSIRTYRGRRAEHIPAGATAPAERPTTCTPANRFRAEYIPNAVLRRDTVPARCPDCAILPKDQPAPELQAVRQPQ